MGVLAPQVVGHVGNRRRGRGGEPVAGRGLARRLAEHRGCCVCRRRNRVENRLPISSFHCGIQQFPGISKHLFAVRSDGNCGKNARLEREKSTAAHNL